LTKNGYPAEAGGKSFPREEIPGEPSGIQRAQKAGGIIRQMPVSQLAKPYFRPIS
jgi:hypothetical protein